MLFLTWKMSFIYSLVTSVVPAVPAVIASGRGWRRTGRTGRRTCGRQPPASVRSILVLVGSLEIVKHDGGPRFFLENGGVGNCRWQIVVGGSRRCNREVDGDG